MLLPYGTQLGLNASTPAGVAISTHHGGNIHGVIYGLAVVSIFITTLTMIIRVYTKFHLMRNRGWDDLPMGAGKHEADVPVSEISTFSELLFVHELMYPWLMGEIKTSIALQLLRIFVPNARLPSNRGYKFWTIWVFVAAEIIWFLCYFFTSLFQCWPVRKTYASDVPGHCLSGFPAFNVAVSGFNMLSDMLMAIIPLIWIWQLRIPRAKKFGAMGVFLVAGFAFAASLLRLIYAINRLAYTDITLTLTQVAISTAAEEAAGILVGNVVTLPRFICEVKLKYRKFRGITEPTEPSMPSEKRRNTVTFDPLYTSATETGFTSDDETLHSSQSQTLPPPPPVLSMPSRQRPPAISTLHRSPRPI